MSKLLPRLNGLLAVDETRFVQDALSGAVGERIVVRPWIDGQLAAVVPARLFVPNGLRMVESAVPGRPGALAGTAHAVANAERRLAKMVGEGWGARLADYDPGTQCAVFTLIRHA